MNNDELKKKIDFIVTDCFYGEKLVADALIAAGIGDVKETEHRAEVAERALKDMAVDYWGVECFCHGCSESGCRNSCGEKYLVFDEGDAINCLVKNFLEQAEKELAEESGEKKEV